MSGLHCCAGEAALAAWAVSTYGGCGASPCAHSCSSSSASAQTLVFKLGLAKSIHHARVLIRQRHIRVGKQIVNIPSFMVRVDSQVRCAGAG